MPTTDPRIDKYIESAAPFAQPILTRFRKLVHKACPDVTEISTPLPMPADFAAALKKTKGATANFQKFPPSHKREYIEWITEAKREETRNKRITTAVQWIAEGKSRNWKYQK